MYVCTFWSHQIDIPVYRVASQENTQYRIHNITQHNTTHTHTHEQSIRPAICRRKLNASDSMYGLLMKMKLKNNNSMIAHRNGSWSAAGGWTFRSYFKLTEK